MKIKSGHILCEQYTYQLDTTVQQFWCIKGRVGMVLEHVQTTLYNKSGNSITVLYYLFKHNGVVSRILYDADLATKDVQRLRFLLYIDAGDEFGFEMDGGANADEFEVFSQWLVHHDEDE